MTGSGRPLVGKMLGHTQPSTTVSYTRLTVDSVCEAAETSGAAMLHADDDIFAAEEPARADCETVRVLEPAAEGCHRRSHLVGDFL